MSLHDPRLLPVKLSSKKKLAKERQDDDEADWDDGIAVELRRDVMRISIREAIPLIANWMAETIGAEEEPFVFNALERMFSEQAKNSRDERMS